MPQRLLKEIVHCQNSASLLRSLAVDAAEPDRKRCFELADTYDSLARALEELTRQLNR